MKWLRHGFADESVVTNFMSRLHNVSANFTTWAPLEA